jgi:hypothetical protein
MSENNDQTKAATPEFDFSRYPVDSLFHERRTGRDRRDEKTPAASPEKLPKSEAHPERRARKDRRRRIDPTTFDKQYTDDEMEFMNAMQRFKECSGKSFPSYREVLRVMVDLGYRLVVVEPDPDPRSSDPDFSEPIILQESTIDA